LATLLANKVKEWEKLQEQIYLCDGRLIITQNELLKTTTEERKYGRESVIYEIPLTLMSNSSEG